MTYMRLYMAAGRVAAARRLTPAPVVRTGVTFVDGGAASEQGAQDARAGCLTPCPNPWGAHWPPSELSAKRRRVSVSVVRP
jgi:hypothetical protein